MRWLEVGHHSVPYKQNSGRMLLAFCVLGLFTWAQWMQQTYNYGLEHNESKRRRIMALSELSLVCMILVIWRTVCPDYRFRFVPVIITQRSCSLCWRNNHFDFRISIKSIKQTLSTGTCENSNGSVHASLAGVQPPLYQFRSFTSRTRHRQCPQAEY